MKARITREGLLVPRELLGEMGEGEVEIRKEPGGRLLILPGGREGADPKSSRQEDPILGLGSHPVADEVSDASEGHDRYLYGAGTEY